MDLFGNIPTLNCLPYDGEALYYGPILNAKEAKFYFECLDHSIAWKNDESIIFGKRIVMERKVALYAQKALTYTYAGIQRQALPWTPELLELKNRVEAKHGQSFNSCLLNYYPSGKHGMSWHADDEKELKEHGAIASLSLGAQRDFLFKHRKTKEKAKVFLENGSLLVMQGVIQKHWLHALPKRMRVDRPRINLTFRNLGFLD
ncbi:MAG: alpha-ketoglutarate-dependent dioxygenase AlkB family protein [Flavicella sp.]